MRELASFSDDLGEEADVRGRQQDGRGAGSGACQGSGTLRGHAELPFFEISSATGEGIEELKFAMAERILAPAASAVI